MRFYQCKHQFYCGVDLHARTMQVCILDQDGAVVLERGIASDRQAFLKVIGPYRDGLVVGVESTFPWYWVADLCAGEQITFVLGHAFYMGLIHGGKAKNDRLDALKIALLLCGKKFPLAYAYPKGWRETRDLLRRRMYLVRQRSALLTHVQIVNSQYNLPALAKQRCAMGDWEELNIAERFSDPCVRESVTVDVKLIDELSRVIDQVERFLMATTRVQDAARYARLRTIPGVGPVLGMVLMYEMHAWTRFAKVGQFLSYARLVRCRHESAGKTLGTGGKKIGNAYLRWAFGEAACLMLRFSERARKWKQRYTSKHGKGKAMSVLAAKLGRAVYHMSRKQEAFDEERFWHSEGREDRRRPGSSANDAGDG
jgi:transposase